jgi:hypothetical protein
MERGCRGPGPGREAARVVVDHEDLATVNRPGEPRCQARGNSQTAPAGQAAARPPAAQSTTAPWPALGWRRHGRAVAAGWPSCSPRRPDRVGVAMSAACTILASRARAGSMHQRTKVAPSTSWYPFLPKRASEADSECPDHVVGERCARSPTTTTMVGVCRSEVRKSSFEGSRQVVYALRSNGASRLVERGLGKLRRSEALSDGTWRSLAAHLLWDQATLSAVLTSVFPGQFGAILPE